MLGTTWPCTSLAHPCSSFPLSSCDMAMLNSWHDHASSFDSSFDPWHFVLHGMVVLGSTRPCLLIPKKRIKSIRKIQKNSKMDRKYEILNLYELCMIMHLFYLKWTNINLIIFKMSLIFTKKMQLSMIIFSWFRRLKHLFT